MAQFTNDGTLRNPYLRGVHDADGNLLPGTTDNNGGTGLNSRLLFEPENAGTHYIAAGANGHRTGTYRVSVAEVGDDHPAGTGTTRTVAVGGDDHPAGAGTTGTVAVGGSATGKIEALGRSGLVRGHARSGKVVPGSTSMAHSRTPGP